MLSFLTIEPFYFMVDHPSYYLTKFVGMGSEMFLIKDGRSVFVTLFWSFLLLVESFSHVSHPSSEL